MERIADFAACDKPSDRLRLFQLEARRISSAFWRDPRTFNDNLVRALEQAFQSGREFQAFRRAA
jgi:hypothetical protein